MRVAARVGGEAGVGELERVADGQGGGAGGAAGGEEAGEPEAEADLLARADEDPLVLLLEGEVHGLGRKVAQAVG